MCSFHAYSAAIEQEPVISVRYQHDCQLETATSYGTSSHIRRHCLSWQSINDLQNHYFLFGNCSILIYGWKHTMNVAIES